MAQLEEDPLTSRQRLQRGDKVPLRATETELQTIMRRFPLGSDRIRAISKMDHVFGGLSRESQLRALEDLDRRFNPPVEGEGTFMERITTNVGTDDHERVQILKGILGIDPESGEDNVQIDPVKGIIFRRPGEAHFTQLDKPGGSISGDIADVLPDVLEGLPSAAVATGGAAAAIPSLGTSVPAAIGTAGLIEGGMAGARDVLAGALGGGSSSGTEAALNVGAGALFGAAGEAVPRGIGKGFGAANIAKRNVTESASRVEDFFTNVVKNPEAGVSIAQATESQLLDIVEEVLGGAFTGGFRSFQINTQDALKGFSQELADRFAGRVRAANQLERGTTGRTIGRMLEGNFNPEKTGTMVIKQNILRDSPGLQVSFEGLADNPLINRELGKVGRKGAFKPREVPDLGPGGVPKFEGKKPLTVSSVSTDLDLEAALELMEAVQDLPATARGRGDALRNIQQRIEAALGGNPNARHQGRDVRGRLKSRTASQADSIREFRVLVDSGAERRSQKIFLEKLVQKGDIGPADVEKMFISGGQDVASNVRALKTMFEETDPTMDMLRAHVLNWAFDGSKSTGKFKNEILSHDKLKDKLFGKQLVDDPTKAGIGGLGRDAVEELYGKDFTRDLDQFVEALAVTQRPGEAAIGGMAIQLMQAGALVGLGAGVFGGPVKFASGAIILGPAALSVLFSNRRGRKLILEGIKPRTGRTAREIARIGNSLVALDKVLKQRMEKMFEPEREPQQADIFSGGAPSFTPGGLGPGLPPQ